MPDLHQQLLAELDKPYEIWAPAEAASALGAQRHALIVVVKLHAPRPCGDFPNDLCLHLYPHNVCATCGSSGTYVIGDPNSTARCSTIQGIAHELASRQETIVADEARETDQPEPVTEAQYAEEFRRIGESEAQILADELAAEQPEGSHEGFTLLPCVKIDGPHPKHTWSHRDEPCSGHVCPGEQPEDGA